MLALFDEHWEFIPQRERVLLRLAFGLQRDHTLSSILATQSLSLYRWSMEMKRMNNKEFYRLLMRYGSVEVLQVVKLHTVTRVACEWAALAGRLDILRILSSDSLRSNCKGKSFVWTANVFPNAVQSGNLELIRAIFDRSLESVSSVNMAVHVVRGWLPSSTEGEHRRVLHELMKGAFGSIPNLGETVMVEAIHNGNLEAIRLLRSGELGAVCRRGELTMDVAIQHDDMAIINFLLAEGYTFGSNSIIYAIRHGNVEVMKLLVDEGLTLTTQHLNHAIDNSNLKSFRALRDGSLGKICPWNETITFSAISRSRYRIFLACRDGSLGEKCPWNKEECRRQCYMTAISQMIQRGELD